MDTREVANQYRLSHWGQMLAERVAGEKVDEFCMRKGITRSQFFYWQRKLRKEARNRIEETTTALVPRGWVACEKSDKPTALSIEIGSCSINVGDGFDSELLKEVCRTLVSLC